MTKADSKLSVMVGKCTQHCSVPDNGRDRIPTQLLRGRTRIQSLAKPLGPLAQRVLVHMTIVCPKTTLLDISM